MVVNIGAVTITSIACALILGILVNDLTSKAKKAEDSEVSVEE